MAEKIDGLSREFIIHPGETLKEILEDRNMSQRELAIRTGVKEAHVSKLVNCLKPISVSFAKKLEYAFGVDASFWINLQANYEKEVADFNEINMISKEELVIVERLKNIIEYIQEIGLLSQEAQESMLVIKLRKLLNISSLTVIPKISQSGAYRLALADNVDPYILFIWIRICDLITINQQTNQDLDIYKLRNKLSLIRKLTFEEDVETIHLKLREYLAECGIKFAIVKHFTGAPVQGVIKRNNDDTLSLIMTVRRKFADVFWFTLFHEIGHILNDDIEDKLIDYDFKKNEVEDSADEFAANALIDLDEYNSFVGSGDFSLKGIRQFCDEHDTPSFILIGRLQKDGHLKYHQYTEEKIKYELDEAEKVMQ